MGFERELKFALESELEIASELESGFEFEFGFVLETELQFLSSFTVDIAPSRAVFKP